MITVRKVKVSISGTDEQRKDGYKYIRDSQYAQYVGLNRAMSYLATAFYSNKSDLNSKGYKEALKELTNSNPIFDDIDFGIGLDTKSAITQKVKADFKIAIKNGLAKGERSVTNYKRTFPLITRGRDVKIYKEENQYKLNWVHKIKMDIIFYANDNKSNKKELKTTLDKIISKEYSLKQCSFEFNNNKLILILTIDIPVEENKKKVVVKGRTLGIDLGLKYPVYMCLNDNTYKRKSLGSINDFLRVREQIRERKRNLQKSLTMTKGGKGREKKLQVLDRLSQNESNFVQTYNHTLSKRVIEFAKQHKCEFINMEKLTKDGFDDVILGKWSYYQLQNFIEYKAKKEGIKVRYIEPAYTSQTCSFCGHVDKENRQTQEKFVCTKCGFGKDHGFKDKNGNIYVNADHNAAINIATSKKYK